MTTEEKRNTAQRNYNATVRRGQIIGSTTAREFIKKLYEEVLELDESDDGFNFDEKELADVSLVCDAMAIHFGIDLNKIKYEKMLYNEQRKD